MFAVKRCQQSTDLERQQKQKVNREKSKKDAHRCIRRSMPPINKKINKKRVTKLTSSRQTARHSNTNKTLRFPAKTSSGASRKTRRRRRKRTLCCSVPFPLHTDIPQLRKATNLSPEMPTSWMSRDTIKQIDSRFANGLIGMEKTHTDIEETGLVLRRDAQ